MMEASSTSSEEHTHKWSYIRNTHIFPCIAAVKMIYALGQISKDCEEAILVRFFV